MDISIIVPVYNVEKFLVRCLNSIFNQVFTGSFEVIVVDDASVDNSLTILKKYQEKEERLKIIEHEFNKKLSSARATGMNAATGDYILHIDSDDWLLPGSLEALFRKSKETDADIVVFNLIREDSNGEVTPLKQIIEGKITMDKLSVHKHFLGTTNNKFMKRSITSNLLYGETHVNAGEDILFCTEILLRAQSICLMTSIFYVYYFNNISITQTINPILYVNNRALILKHLRSIIEFYKYYNKDHISAIIRKIKRDLILNSVKIIIQGKTHLVDYKQLNENCKYFANYSETIDIDVLKQPYLVIWYSIKIFGVKTTAYTIITSLKHRIVKNQIFSA